MRVALICLLALAAIGPGCAQRGTATAEGASSAESAALDSLRSQFVRATAPAGGRVGVSATLLGTDESVVLAADERFPMQSVFKLPLAMTVLDAVDRGALDLNQPVRVAPADFVSERQAQPDPRPEPRGRHAPARGPPPGCGFGERRDGGRHAPRSRRRPRRRHGVRPQSRGWTASPWP